MDTLRVDVADVKWFLLFLVLTMWGFAGAFYILFREDQQQFQVTMVVISLLVNLFNSVLAAVSLCFRLMAHPSSGTLFHSQCEIPT